MAKNIEKKIKDITKMEYYTYHTKGYYTNKYLEKQLKNYLQL